MADEGKPGSWWHTLPGVLTAVAGIIGAVSGLLIALNQIGFFEAAKEPQPKKAEVAPPKPAPPQPPAPAKPERRPAAAALEPPISIPCPTPRASLRTRSAVIARDEVQRMVVANGFFDVHLNPGHKGFPNEFRPREFRGDKVVIDYATCLMWKQSASPTAMTWYEAPNYASQLNKQRYAGFSDWRVPSIEELASLMEPGKGAGGYFLDPVFDVGPGTSGCWSVDRKEYATAADTAWPAGFSYGGLVHGGFAGSPNCVLAVRSLQ